MVFHDGKCKEIHTTAYRHSTYLWQRSGADEGAGTFTRVEKRFFAVEGYIILVIIGGRCSQQGRVSTIPVCITLTRGLGEGTRHCGWITLHCTLTPPPPPPTHTKSSPWTERTYKQLQKTWTSRVKDRKQIFLPTVGPCGCLKSKSKYGWLSGRKESKVV